MVKSKSKSLSEKARSKLNEKAKLAMRKYKEKVKQDPEKYEETKRQERERYYRRKEQGKIKSIKELSSRKQREMRRIWRKKSKKCYDKKKKIQQMVEGLETPPSSPQSANEDRQQIPQDPGPSGRTTEGKRRSQKNKKQLKATIKELKLQLAKEKKKKEKYKKRLSRQKADKKDSPNTNVKEMTRGQSVSSEVKQGLLFGEVISSQIKDNISRSSLADKRKFASQLTGRIVQKYRFQEKIKSLVPKSYLYSKKTLQKRKNLGLQIKTKVQEFYEDDDSSRICPGKKETITRKKMKKQKRYLNYSIKDLYAKFLESHPGTKISYVTFSRLRLFWVVSLDVRKRETCLCEIHVNFEIVVSRLKFYNMIRENSCEEIIRSIKCSSQKNIKEACLNRICPDCRTIEIITLEYDPGESVRFGKWITKKAEQIIKGERKICTKKVKVIISATKQELVLEFKNALPKFMVHHSNMIHQYNEIKKIKQSLSENDALIHMDFSENYLCKYSEEIQSAHFGGSKPQITLHTRYRKSQNESEPTTTSYCSISKSLRHDPSAVCAHLMPILNELKTNQPTINTVHFLSDGPSTQYKNKKMFFFLLVLGQILKANSIRWHYFESHHGKGAPDGIGGCVKRTADNIVARGEDIPNYETLIGKLQILKGIKILSINDTEILDFDSKLPQSLQSFKGTLKVHEAVWSKSEPRKIRFRSLTCASCSSSEVCLHYDLGYTEYTADESSCEDDLDMDLELEDELIPNKENTHKKLCYKQVYGSDTDSEDGSSSTRLEEHPSNRQYSCSPDNNLNRPDSAQNDPLNIGEYVLVKIYGKKDLFCHYVAIIISIEETDYVVKYFRKISKGNVFVFPDVEDIALISNEDIVSVLNKPTIRRGQHTFDIPYVKKLR